MRVGSVIPLRITQDYADVILWLNGQSNRNKAVLEAIRAAAKAYTPEAPPLNEEEPEPVESDLDVLHEFLASAGVSETGEVPL